MFDDLSEIKGQKVTKSDSLPKCPKFWSNVKKLQNLNNDQNVKYSNQKKFKNLNNDQNVIYSNFKKLQNLNNDQNVTNDWNVTYSD